MSTYQPIQWRDELFAGEDKTVEFTVFQSDDATIQDVTGWNVEWTMKRRVDEVVVLSKDQSNGGVELIDEVAGLIQVNIFSGDTSGIPTNVQYEHELRRVDVGFETVLAWGEVVLR